MPLFAREKIGLLMAMILVWPTAARANIGDDISQLRARYGAAKILINQVLFQVRLVNDQLVRLPPSADQKQGYSVSVYFDADHSAMEVFTPIADDPGKSEMDQRVIDRILDSESDGKTWNPVQVHSGKPTWVRSDNKIIARFDASVSGKPGDASALVIMLNGK